jgi:hypothetical protein
MDLVKENTKWDCYYSNQPLYKCAITKGSALNITLITE